MVISYKSKKQKISYSKIYGFDIETYGKNNKFVMGSIYGENGKFIKVFWDKIKMQDYIIKSHKMRGCRLFATNLNFDYFALYPEIEIYSQFEMLMRGDGFIRIEYGNKNKICFEDTLNFMKASVEQLGEILNIDKLEKPSCFAKRPKTILERFELEKYNIRDSEITYRFMIFLNDVFKEMGINMRSTIASTAMTLYKTNYMPFNMKQPYRNWIIEMYNGYYGGRNEVFLRGKVGKLNYYDVNSLYPYVMKKYKYPNPNKMRFVEKSNNDNLKYSGMSYCKIIAPDLNIPLLPYKKSAKDKLLFPIGKFEGWYCHNELNKALSIGYKIKVIKSYICTEDVDLFSDYVSDLYNKRMRYKKQKSKIELAIKLCLNGLYGKFGQKIYQSQVCFINNPEHKLFIDNCHKENALRQNENIPPRYDIICPIPKFKIINNITYDISEIFYIIDTEIEEYASFINPMISAYITAYARIELFDIMIDIKNKGGKVYYVDTDSVMTDIKLSESENLGGLKLEINSDRGIIVKPKFYYLHSDTKEFIKCKGLRNLKTYIDFEKTLKTKKHKYIRFSKFRESIRNNMSFNKMLDIKKILDMEDNKRIWERKFSYTEIQHSKPIIMQ